MALPDSHPDAGNKDCVRDKKKKAVKILLPRRSGGDRTLDPMIKSHVLYQLSYGPEFNSGANLVIFPIMQVYF